MTKNRKMNKNGKKKTAKAARPKAPTAGANNAEIDKYLRMLGDPCGAQLTRAPYLGTGAGYLARTKQWVITTQSTGAVDFYVEIHPGGVLTGAGGTLCMGSYGYSTTTGGSLGTATPILLPGFLTGSSVGYFRPVAGCARVVYNGTEMNRAGVVGTSLQTGLQVFPAEAIGITATDLLTTSQRVNRLGVEATEIRWVPQESDGDWSSYNQLATGLPSTNWKGSSMIMVGQGVPAGSVSIEVTMVWEWQVNSQATSAAGVSGLVADIVKPPSFTLNSALSRIGDVVKFANSPDGRTQIARAAHGVYNALGYVSAGVAAIM